MARNLDGLGRKVHRWRGRWRSYLTVGYLPNGNPDRRYVYGSTAEECQAALDALRREKEAGSFSGTVARPGTLGAWLDTWLEEKARTVKPRTLTIYRHEIGNVPERLKRTRLDRLTPLDVQKALAYIADTKSPRASKAARTVLSAAMRDAVRLGVASRNPVSVVSAVAYQPAESTVWTAAEVFKFLEASEEGRSWYRPLFYTALATGARMGELFALTWGDLNGATLSIEKTLTGQGKNRGIGTPKTRAGRRLVHLGSDVLEMLTDHRRSLELTGLPVDPSALMFPAESEEGGPLNHSNTRRALHHWADKAGVPRIRPHDLRHTYASMAIAQGATPADLARQLGHADPGFTLKRYVHFFERARPRAVPTLAELLGSAA